MIRHDQWENIQDIPWILVQINWKGKQIFKSALGGEWNNSSQESSKKPSISRKPIPKTPFVLFHTVLIFDPCPHRYQQHQESCSHRHERLLFVVQKPKKRVQDTGFFSGPGEQSSLRLCKACVVEVIFYPLIHRLYHTSWIYPTPRMQSRQVYIRV